MRNYYRAKNAKKMQFSPDNILLYSSAEYILNKDEYLKIQNRIAVYQSETKTKSAV